MPWPRHTQADSSLDQASTSALLKAWRGGLDLPRQQSARMVKGGEGDASEKPAGQQSGCPARRAALLSRRHSFHAAGRPPVRARRTLRWPVPSCQHHSETEVSAGTPGPADAQTPAKGTHQFHRGPARVLHNQHRSQQPGWAARGPCAFDSRLSPQNLSSDVFLDSHL